LNWINLRTRRAHDRRKAALNLRIKWSLFAILLKFLQSGLCGIFGPVSIFTPEHDVQEAPVRGRQTLKPLDEKIGKPWQGVEKW
jgi:hypothetical protein